jgi:hypothetical protein
VSGAFPRDGPAHTPFLENNPADPTTPALKPLPTPHAEAQTRTLVEALFLVTDIQQEDR